jgi:large subunit ribosomal protein L4
MPKANLYNEKGEQIGDIELNPKIFEVTGKNVLVHQAVKAQLQSSRVVTTHVKDRGEVRGGGKKPWKQKGTGRARHGSIRSPLWRGGGVTFGPSADRNYELAINKKMKRKAMFIVLSDRAENAMISVMEKLEFQAPKTKKITDLIKKMGLAKKPLFIIEKMDQAVMKSVRNITGANLIVANSLNVVDLMKSSNVIFTKNALKELENVYLKG